MTQELILGFADRRDAAGRYPVTDSQGSVVATIEKAALRNQFTAYDAGGAPLCSGSLRTFGPWVAVDPAGAVIVELSRSSLKRQRADLRNGTVTALLQGVLFSRQWSLIDPSGAPLIAAVPHEAGWLFAPDSWLVRSVLTLAETVAVVELHRLDLKRRRNDSAPGAV